MNGETYLQNTRTQIKNFAAKIIYIYPQRFEATIG